LETSSLWDYQERRYWYFTSSQEEGCLALDPVAPKRTIVPNAPGAIGPWVLGFVLHLPFSVSTKPIFAARTPTHPPTTHSKARLGQMDESDYMLVNCDPTRPTPTSIPRVTSNLSRFGQNSSVLSATCFCFTFSRMITHG